MKYLLTYSTDNGFYYDWFDTEEEAREYIEKNNFNVINFLEVLDYKQLTP